MDTESILPGTGGIHWSIITHLLICSCFSFLPSRMQGHPINTSRSSQDGSVSTVNGKGSGSAGLTGGPGFHADPHPDHFYSEIPQPPTTKAALPAGLPSTMDGQQPDPFQHLQKDLKGLDYHSQAATGKYNYSKGSSSMGPPPPPLSSSTTLQSNKKSYGAAFTTVSGSTKETLSTGLSTQGGGGAGKMGSGHSKIDDLDLDIYTRMRSPVCICTRQVTIHVTIMFLAGIAYLGVGGIMGFYLGRTCKYLYYISNFELLNFTSQLHPPLCKQIRGW